MTFSLSLEIILQQNTQNLKALGITILEMNIYFCDLKRRKNVFHQTIVCTNKQIPSRRIGVVLFLKEKAFCLFGFFS